MFTILVLLVDLSMKWLINLIYELSCARVWGKIPYGIDDLFCVCLNLRQCSLPFTYIGEIFVSSLARIYIYDVHIKIDLRPLSLIGIMELAKICFGLVLIFRRCVVMWICLNVFACSFYRKFNVLKSNTSSNNMREIFNLKYLLLQIERLLYWIWRC